MSSILTNNGATTALATLKSINMGIENTQYQISTGKKVASSADDAAAWAISKAMEADVQGFQKISESLSLGQSTVSVARMGAETVTDLLTEVKGKIVASQEENVDRDKIQADIESLRDQIGSIVAAASFNGANLLQNTETTSGSGSVNVLASLDRSSSGVSASDITISKQDLGTGAATLGTTGAADAVGGTVNDGATGVAVTFSAAAASGNTYVVESGAAGLSANVGYVAREGDTLTDVTGAMVERLNFQAESDGIDISFATNSNAGEIVMTNNSGANITIANTATNEATGGTVGGSLELLSKIDVTTDNGSEAALGAIEGMIQGSIDAAASFGSAQGRLETQSDFVDKLSSNLKSGIGALVDTDMEEASAKLKALQVQQQLAVQSLSMANSAPQQLLSLFR
ncbi:MAG: flagellin [Pelagimonas sp.]